MTVDWDKRFIDLAKHIANWSKDKNTKVGTVIANNEHRIVTIGYNGFPSMANDQIESRYERPTKYLYTEHAERNAIYNAARIGVSLIDCSVYLTLFPCADCARAIIQSGITNVICCDPPNVDDNKWGEHFKVSLELFNECGVNVKYITH